MSVNGKRDDIERDDLIALANAAQIKKARANEWIDRVVDVVRRWPEFAAKADVADSRVKEIQAQQRTSL